YCGSGFAPEVMTLDHVAPRRGQSAYDRRDNLVLACPGCNTAKADTPLLAFLLARRGRAASFVRYADHLSPMLLALAREIAGPSPEEPTPTSDPDSPYRD